MWTHFALFTAQAGSPSYCTTVVMSNTQLLQWSNVHRFHNKLVDHTPLKLIPMSLWSLQVNYPCRCAHVIESFNHLNTRSNFFFYRYNFCMAVGSITCVILGAVQDDKDISISSCILFVTSFYPHCVCCWHGCNYKKPANHKWSIRQSCGYYS